MGEGQPWARQRAHLQYWFQINHGLLEQQRLTAVEGALSQMIDEQDRLAVQVLCVQQVLPWPVQCVVLTHSPRKLILTPRSKVPAHGAEAWSMVSTAEDDVAHWWEAACAAR